MLGFLIFFLTVSLRARRLVLASESGSPSPEPLAGGGRALALFEARYCSPIRRRSLARTFVPSPQTRSLPTIFCRLRS